MATGPLGALSHDELGVIFDGLADPLEPVVAVALSSTCLGLRTPLWAALEVLKQQHNSAKALCRELHTSIDRLINHSASSLFADHIQFLFGVDAVSAANNLTALSLILKWLPRQNVCLRESCIGDAGMQALFEGLGRGALPSLLYLSLGRNQFGPAGAEALAAALRRGAMPNLETLDLARNPIGHHGLTALVAPLRKLPAFKTLHIHTCEIGDEGVASLVADLGKDDFKALETLYLCCPFNSAETNLPTDQSCTTLISVLNSAAIPKLARLDILRKDSMSPDAMDALTEAVKRRDITMGWYPADFSDSSSDEDAEQDEDDD